MASALKQSTTRAATIVGWVDARKPNQE